MKSHILKFAEKNRDIFKRIKNGTKKVETRACTVRYKEIKAGDVLVMSCAGEKFEKKIKNVFHFQSISELLKKYSPEDINSFTHSEEELTKEYYSYPDYKEKIEKSGILAFELE